MTTIQEAHFAVETFNKTSTNNFTFSTIFNQVNYVCLATPGAICKKHEH